MMKVVALAVAVLGESNSLHNLVIDCLDESRSTIICSSGSGWFKVVIT